MDGSVVGAIYRKNECAVGDHCIQVVCVRLSIVDNERRQSTKRVKVDQTGTLHWPPSRTHILIQISTTHRYTIFKATLKLVKSLKYKGERGLTNPQQPFKCPFETGDLRRFDFSPHFTQKRYVVCCLEENENCFPDLTKTRRGLKNQ